MKYFKIKPFFFLLLFAFIFLFGNSPIYGQNIDISKLIGNWKYSSPQGSISLIFKSENILVYNGSEANYSLQPGYIIIQEDYNYSYYAYSFENNRLKITYPEGYTLTFEKERKTKANENKLVKNKNTTNSNQFLYGKLCHWSGSSNYSSSYSNTLWAYFDGKGNFTYGSESSFSSGTGIAYGDDNSGQNSGTYQITGNIINLHFSDNTTGKATINMQQDDGRITEIMYEGDLYATSLCD